MQLLTSEEKIPPGVALLEFKEPSFFKDGSILMPVASESVVIVEGGAGEVVEQIEPTPLKPEAAETPEVKNTTEPLSTQEKAVKTPALSLIFVVVIIVVIAVIRRRGLL